MINDMKFKVIKLLNGTNIRSNGLLLNVAVPYGIQDSKHLYLLLTINQNQ